MHTRGNVNANTHHHDLTLHPCGMERSLHCANHTGTYQGQCTRTTMIRLWPLTPAVSKTRNWNKYLYIYIYLFTVYSYYILYILYIYTVI